jgi:hypothetical protein
LREKVSPEATDEGWNAAGSRLANHADRRDPSSDRFAATHLRFDGLRPSIAVGDRSETRKGRRKD